MEALTIKTKEQITIRFATQDDLDTVLKLCLALIHESRFNNKTINVNKITGIVKNCIEQKAENCVILAMTPTGEIAGLLIGLVMDYFFCDGRLAQDRCFFVKPEYRGSDAAPKLIIGFRKWALERSAQELCINQSVDIDPRRFNAFMSKMGFSLCGSNFSLQLRDC